MLFMGFFIKIFLFGLIVSVLGYILSGIIARSIEAKSNAA